MSLIKDLQQALGSAEDNSEKVLEIVFYSDKEICIFINEKRIPISVFPFAETSEERCYIDVEGYSFRLTVDEISLIFSVMEVIIQEMDKFKEMLEDF